MLTLKEIDRQKADRDEMVYQMKAIEDGGQQPIKKVREVLDEESFVEGLEKIITRDYYPDLCKIQEYKRWKEESHKTGVGISDLLSKVSEQESVKRAVFEKDLDKMTLSQYITKYTSEDNNSLEKMMERDRERYLEKHSWMFKPYLAAQEKNKQLQSESDNKLKNMIEGTSSGGLQFIASDPMSKFIFCPSRPAIESYSDPFSYYQKQIVKENTRLPEFMRPATQHASGIHGSTALGKRAALEMNTPNLLGLRRETSPSSKTPFNLREMLGEEEPNPEDTMESGVFRPLRFPSPSPSMLDSPLMTWGDIETEPLKLGPVSQREAYQENPREKLAHELSSKLLEKTKLRNKKKEAQLQKILTPYAKHLTDQRNSALISHISSKLMSNKNSSLYKSYFNTPKPAPGKLNDQK